MDHGVIKISPQLFATKKLSVFLQQYSKIIVASRDSGAAYILAYFIKVNDLQAKCSFILEGPAIEIFKSYLGKISFVNTSILNSSNSLNTVLITGKSELGNTERLAISVAKKHRIVTLSFIDHWINYWESFLPLSVRKATITSAIANKYYPDIVVVGDQYGLQIAKKIPHLCERVIFEKCAYFAKIKDRLSKLPYPTSRSILYLSEPLHSIAKKLHGAGDYWGYDEFQILDDMIRNITQFSKQGFNKLIIRVHPRENKAKYANIVKIANTNYKSFNFTIEISTNSSLEEDLKRSRLVIGARTMGLVHAIFAGRKTISYIPKSSIRKCELPHSEIIKIRDLEELNKIDLS